LIEALPQNGVAFLNSDDPYVAQFGRDFPGRAFYFGSGPAATLQTTSVTEDEAGVHVSYHWEDQTGTFTLPMIGTHNASNALAALAVAIEAGVDPAKAALALESLKPGDKRGETLQVNDLTILNDCYNSNPEALKSMIRSLASRAIPAGGRRILIAGEMLELGEQGPALHKSCGHAAAEAGLDLVVGVRGNAEHLATAVCSAGVAALFLADAEAAGKWMVENLRKSDLILLKGSRGVKLELALSIYLDHKLN
jgi:UDP-N-acetylmuramoyl-tripeptide--D-alanyl-D-alanine ligase